MHQRAPTTPFLFCVQNYQKLLNSIHGVVLVGTPINNDEFCKHFWKITLIQEITLFLAWCAASALPVWQVHHFQVQLLLAALRAAAALFCWTLCTHPSISSKRLSSHSWHCDPLTTDDFQSIISDKIWLQSILPPKMGGFGIQDPCIRTCRHSLLQHLLEPPPIYI